MYTQTEKELESHFKTILKFIKKSAKDYDKGEEDEAVRIASSLRTLLHDTASSTSLLTLLGIKSINFLDTAHPVDDSDCASQHGLFIIQHINQRGVKYIPRFWSPDKLEAKYKPFDDWWKQVVFVDQTKNTLSRKDVVLAVANKDGGSHVDPFFKKQFEQNYASLTRDNSLGWYYETADGVVKEPPLNNPAFCGIRQIAHEVLETIDKNLVNP